MDYSKKFLILEQIEELIELPFSDIREMLTRYIYFKGLVYSPQHGPTYVDGYFIIEATSKVYDRIPAEEIDYDYPLCSPDNSISENLHKIKGTGFSNNEKLIGQVFDLKSPQELDVVFYSYKQICELMEGLGCPQPKCTTELSKKKYAYDTKLVDQKSSFTLFEVSQIAANLNVTFHERHQQGLVTKLREVHPLVGHYLEIISECVKGHNQHGFHLLTLELWVNSYDYDLCASSSKKFDNDTKLVISSKVNVDLTIISKAEFIRWCKYMDIETGLTCDQKLVDESVEELLLKIEILEKKIDEQNMEIINLNLIDNPNEKLNNLYPPELQLAIDAFEELCLDQDKRPTNKDIEKWLDFESKKRSITHKDGGKELQGLSNKKLETIPSIIKSQ